jgi:hypothetical protein
MLWCLRLIGVGVGRFDGIHGKYWQREQLASARDVVGAFAAGEQAIVALMADSSTRFSSISIFPVSERLFFPGRPQTSRSQLRGRG